MILLSFIVFFIDTYPENTQPRLPETTQPPASAVPNIHIHNENNHTFSQTQNFKFGINIKYFAANLKHYLQELDKEKIKKEIKDQAITLGSFSYTYCKTHKGKITLGMIGGLYAAIGISLVYLSYKILQQATWSSWKDTIPNDMLTAVPHQELGKELLFAIQQRYQTPKNLTDFLTPLVLFLQDVDKEIALLNKFLRLHDWLHIMRLSILFPRQEVLIQRTHEKLQRLSYLRQVFLHWVTDYKITVNTSQ